MYNGSLGGIALAPESVAYGTAGTILSRQHGIESSITLVENRVKPPTLGSNAPNTGLRLNTHVAGNLVLGMTRKRTELGVLYDNFETLATNSHVFGTGVPSNNSFTVFSSYQASGLSYNYTGCVARSITWDLRGGGDFAQVSADIIGQAMVKGSQAVGTVPASADLVSTSGLALLTGDTGIASLKSATITYERTVSGIERQRMGSATMPQPVIGGERPIVRATFTVEYDANTVVALDKFLAGTTAGALTCGDFVLAGCQPLGEIPTLQRGFMEATFTVEATSLTLTTISGT